MVISETILGASNVLFKLASNNGSDLRILVAYRFLFAAGFMVPVALFVERNKRPKLIWKVIWLSLLSALVGLEKLNWDKASGKAKVMGTLLSLAGAMVLTLYKGPNLINWNTHLNLSHHPGRLMGTHPNMILGACSALGSITCYALWMILQSITLFPTLVLQLHRLEEGREYAEFAHQPKRKYTDFAPVRKKISDEIDRERHEDLKLYPPYRYIYSPNEVNVPVVGGHAGITILPLFSQATPTANLSDEVLTAPTKRTQDGGVVCFNYGS